MAGDALARAEELLARLEETRARLEGTEDPNVALELMEQLNQIAKDVQSELERAKRDADAPS